MLLCHSSLADKIGYNAITAESTVNVSTKDVVCSNKTFVTVANDNVFASNFKNTQKKEQVKQVSPQAVFALEYRLSKYDVLSIDINSNCKE